MIDGSKLLNRSHQLKIRMNAICRKTIFVSTLHAQMPLVPLPANVILGCFEIGSRVNGANPPFFKRFGQSHTSIIVPYDISDLVNHID